MESQEYKTIKLAIEKPIAWIILNRPDRLNAINPDMVNELNRVLNSLEDSEDIRVLIITGEGKAFSAGADINTFTTLTPFKAMLFSKRIQETFNKIMLYAKPVIAAINGYALGGGLELAMSCDIRIASENAQLGQPEINLGIIPGAGGTQRLQRLANRGAAKMIIFNGERINAQEALRIGLVDEVVPLEKLKEEAKSVALKLAEKSPLALMSAKYSIELGAESNIWSGLALEASLFGLMFSTKDASEGINAFLQKRKPEFKGI